MAQATNIFALLAGPAGGLAALAYAFGCASGYGFAIRTAYRAVKVRLDKVELERDKDRLRYELERANDRATCRHEIVSLQQHQRDLVDMMLGRRQLGIFTPPPDPPVLVTDADIQVQLEELEKKK